MPINDINFSNGQSLEKLFQDFEDEYFHYEDILEIYVKELSEAIAETKAKSSMPEIVLIGEFGIYIYISYCFLM